MSLFKHTTAMSVVRREITEVHADYVVVAEYLLPDPNGPFLAMGDPATETGVAPHRVRLPIRPPLTAQQDRRMNMECRGANPRNCMHDELKARLAEAEHLILRMAGEDYQRARFYVEKYDLTGERAAVSANEVQP